MTASKSGAYARRRVIRLGAFQDDLCFFCEEPLVYRDPTRSYRHHMQRAEQPNTASCDHYLSRKAGGSGRKENTVIACRVCNSDKGHEPTPEFDEKLRLLNIRRGYGDENGIIHPDTIRDHLEPRTFASGIPSLDNLCDIANKIEGMEGQKIRRLVARRINSHRALLKELNSISIRGLKAEIVGSLRQTRRAGADYRLPMDVEDHLENVLSTITKRWLG